MVEAGEHSVSVVGLKLGVNVLFGVHVNEAHASTSIIIVSTCVVHSYCIDSHSKVGNVEFKEAVD